MQPSTLEQIWSIHATELASAKSIYDRSILDWNIQIDSLKRQIASHEAFRVDSVANASNSVSIEDYRLIEIDLNSLDKDYKYIETTYKSLESEYNNLNTEYTTLNSEFTRLSEQHTESTSNVADLTDQLTQTTNDLHIAKQQSDANLCRISDLQDMYSSNGSELKSKITELTQTVDLTQTMLSESNTRTEALEAENLRLIDETRRWEQEALVLRNWNEKLEDILGRDRMVCRNDDDSRYGMDSVNNLDNSPLNIKPMQLTEPIRVEPVYIEPLDHLPSSSYHTPANSPVNSDSPIKRLGEALSAHFEPMGKSTNDLPSLPHSTNTNYNTLHSLASNTVWLSGEVPLVPNNSPLSIRHSLESLQFSPIQSIDKIRRDARTPEFEPNEVDGNRHYRHSDHLQRNREYIDYSHAATTPGTRTEYTPNFHLHTPRSTQLTPNTSLPLTPTNNSGRQPSQHLRPLNDTYRSFKPRYNVDMAIDIIVNLLADIQSNGKCNASTIATLDKAVGKINRLIANMDLGNSEFTNSHSSINVGYSGIANIGNSMMDTLFTKL